MKQIRVTVFIIAALLVLCAGFTARSVSAHPVGFSWEKTNGNYLMDVGYDTDVFIAGEYVRFDFALKDPATKDPRDFTQAWVRITDSDGKRTLLATGVYNQSIGPTTLLYLFAEPGPHSLEVSFRDKDGNDLAVGSFPLVVKPADGGGSVPLQIAGAVLALIGAAGAGYWIGHVRKRSHTV